MSSSNFFQLAGILIVALAVWMLVDPAFMISLAQEQQNYQYALFILLGIGILMVLLAFCGCCGACKESQCMLVSVSFQMKSKRNFIVILCQLYFSSSAAFSSFSQLKLLLAFGHIRIAINSKHS
jgi:hypothetical protein